MLPAERRMQRIARALKADPCHNADRIMRLPGTINLLSDTKVRAGRNPAMAEVVEFQEDRLCDIEDFPEPDEPRAKLNGHDARPKYDNGRDEFERTRCAARYPGRSVRRIF